MTETSTQSGAAAQPRGAIFTAFDDKREVRARVLVVEDNVITQLVTSHQLHSIGCQPKTVSSGDEALEALEHQTFDLIFLDCVMPNLDGYETARGIRRYELSRGRPRAAIVAVTGDSDVECVDKCMAAGMDGHLTKPTNREVLRAVLDRYLTR